MQPWESCDHVLPDPESLATAGPLREQGASLPSKYTMADTMRLENTEMSPSLTWHKGKEEKIYCHNRFYWLLPPFISEATSENVRL